MDPLHSDGVSWENHRYNCRCGRAAELLLKALLPEKAPFSRIYSLSTHIETAPIVHLNDDDHIFTESCEAQKLLRDAVDYGAPS